MLKKILTTVLTVAVVASPAFAGGQLAEDAYPTVITEVPASALDLWARTFGIVLLAGAGTVIGLRRVKGGYWPSAAILIGIPSVTLACATFAMILSYGERAALTLGAVNLTAGTVVGTVAYAAILAGFALFGCGERQR